eukprot:6353804-Pyramimonas_sp.AAC.1
MLRVLRVAPGGGVSVGAVEGLCCRRRARILYCGNAVLRAAKVVVGCVFPMCPSALRGRPLARPP